MWLFFKIKLPATIYIDKNLVETSQLMWFFSGVSSKITKLRFHCFAFIPKTGMGLPKTKVSFYSVETLPLLQGLYLLKVLADNIQTGITEGLFHCI